MSITISVILAAIYLFLISTWILKGRFFKVDGFPVKLFLGAFYLKLGIAFVFYLIYTYHYPTEIGQNDTKTFYLESGKLYNIAMIAPIDYVRLCHQIEPHSPEIKQEILKFQYWRKFYDSSAPNDTRQVLIYYSWLQVLACYSEGLMLLLANFLSFLGLFALFKVFLSLHIKPWAAFIACFCIPSVLFWTSGLLKEIWLILFLGFTLLFFFSYFQHRKKRDLFLFFGFAYLLLSVKIYIGLILLPLLALYAIKFKFPKIKLLYLYGISGLGAVVGLLLLNFYHPDFNLIGMLTVKRNDFIDMLRTSGHEAILLQPTDGSLLRFILEIPHSIYLVLFKPLPWDVHNFGTLLAALENSVFLFFLGLIFWFFKKDKKVSINTICLFGVLILILAIMMGYTTPNMGALTRYKSPLMPFFFVLLSTYFNENAFLLFLKKRR